MKTFSHLRRYLADFFLEWEIIQINILEKTKTYISCSVILRRLWDNVEKYGGAREDADNMALARGILDK
jgi:hypothetical protein